jgi:outer membrane protein assembly factor BamB
VWHADGAGHGRPAIDGGSVYFLSSRHEVVALDASNGTERWRQNTNEPGATTEGSAIVVAGPVVVAGDYNLVAFDRINGTFRWRFVPAVGSLRHLPG